jgi:hypothetical protein
MLEDIIHKDKCCYDESKKKYESPKDWKIKEKSGFQKKGFMYFTHKNFGKDAQSGHLSRSVHQQFFLSQSRNNPTKKSKEREKDPKK